jgi:2-C-methyl-D-erythritol 4-phosphate cytidylyltransferase/2-C-methyl-D-erythritol 2,4-cyclodiphosphate synthase
MRRQNRPHAHLKATRRRRGPARADRRSTRRHGAGDIGQHFPDTDLRWKGAASAIFLREALRLVRARGGTIGNVDVTLLCEAPKIAPHREAMCQRIAELLELDPSRVGVKATTTEGLGFTGRREGIAALATATVIMG